VFDFALPKKYIKFNSIMPFWAMQRFTNHIWTLKKLFLEMGRGREKFIWNGGDTRWSSKMGGVPMCRRKWGGDSCASEGRAKRVTPAQHVFGTFPYSIYLFHDDLGCLYLHLYLSIWGWLRSSPSKSLFIYFMMT
jgi:hypothetical protein